ncbi:ABC transporter ATP-binding protein [Oceanomicrobium pacificus]|uniref:sn-glycerol-3-phosphate ABC transporter ATP-binding protein UgpC n=1 Tax=Oceanomicrobium pacificus TaxID=2692916 RepID=A0A6B0TVN6_9RHOB|nr:ABC transporter ATP-binding protein [Oceanomicrobium pacificus]MXU65053.1 sn-glycerol-3-phosphate ABC transporter ATP-binding protein UgpC [Oceanomicrobium pacificus]
MAQVDFVNVDKSYGSFRAVKDVSFTVGDGEFVALVGPSGCGKTTTLNLIAGLLDLTGGEIRVSGKVINDLDPKDRDIAMVFQNYALYPNKTVAQNLGFPLRMRKVAKAEIKDKVEEAARLLDITHLLDRYPRELSGGQQQRVALGRALVRDPQVFLMDEPLSNLDAKLRVQMRAELKRFHQDLNATVIYVTHDQLEAMTMADKMAVMSGGVLQQYDAPERVFEEPANLFVASFVGSPAMNLLPATRVERDGTVFATGEGWELTLSDRNGAAARRSETDAIILGARHSSLALHETETSGAIPARIYTVEPTGDLTYAHVEVGDKTFVISVPPDRRIAADQPVWIGFDQNKLHLFDAKTEQRIAQD